MASDPTPRLPERLEGRGDLLLRPWRPDDAAALGRAVAESAEHLRPAPAPRAGGAGAGLLGPPGVHRARAGHRGGALLTDAAFEVPGIAHVEVHHDRAWRVDRERWRAGAPQHAGRVSSASQREGHTP